MNTTDKPDRVPTQPQTAYARLEEWFRTHLKRIYAWGLFQVAYGATIYLVVKYTGREGLIHFMFLVSTSGVFIGSTIAIIFASYGKR